MKTVVITGSTRGLGKLSPGIMITDFLTSFKQEENL